MAEGDPERHTVDITVPARFRYELTDKEIEELKQSDHSLPHGIDPVEWEPAGRPDETTMTISRSGGDGDAE